MEKRRKSAAFLVVNIVFYLFLYPEVPDTAQENNTQFLK